MRPSVNPGRVTWAGDHLLLALRPPDATTDTTYVSFYRTVYSPAGAGYTALVQSDLAVEPGATPTRAIFTDNRLLTEWVRQHLTRRPGHPFRDPSLPVVEARFETSGAVGQVLRETIYVEGNHEGNHKGNHKGLPLRHAPASGIELPLRIDLMWRDFETPFYLEAPQGVIGQDYDIFSLICPAASGTVVINGQTAEGQPYPNDAWTRSAGQPRSSALVAVCEVLIDLHQEDP